MGLKCGIVGLPNVGKSTLFNALTKSHSAPAENFPFCTIEPNLGVVEIPDTRFTHLSSCIQPKKQVPATVEFVDIAGLVQGASEGEGLGNQFLSHIRQANAILHLLCCFEDKNVTHISGDTNPIRDVEIIQLELILADIETINKRLQKLTTMKKGIRSSEQASKNILSEKELLSKIVKKLSEEISIHVQALGTQALLEIKHLNLLTAKPILLVANMSEDDIQSPEKCRHFLNLQHYAQQNKMNILPVSAKIEEELIDLNETEEKEFLQEFALQEPGLNRIIRTVNTLLGHITFLLLVLKKLEHGIFLQEQQLMKRQLKYTQIFKKVSYGLK